ncbi:Surface lipoprotein [Polaromonas sp. CG9_12]|uniref:MlaA family lipoprotein n=1 Tax=Polaromonas sp. CG_9.11 TaxID=2787730 RepID=UPI0004DDD9D3|nr:VacJ family lipoprotein [Polaromonas sp. CG_9.11]MBG6075986.1 phospholipid-binding lipoprotein MlaA [Polaromonas sp. CG_9.11]CDS51278.1 Surface lipoprotein [Polaromonas sp. CG9_12]
MNQAIPLYKVSGWAATALAIALLQGCATGPQANPADPLEPFNRGVYSFNEGLDRAVLKPVATAYQNITPSPVRTGVTNFFANISDVWSMVNNVLQARPAEAMDSLFRVTTNTLWGVGGIFDVATELKIPRHKEDFGQTLGTWGLASGPYVVLPLFGPSSVRDTAGLVVGMQGDLVSQSNNVPVRNSLKTLDLVDTRANLLGAGDLLDQAALDKYAFTRDAYLQRRKSLIGGNERTEPEERFDLPEVLPAGVPAVPVPNPL